MVTRLLGRKLGMTQVYNDKGQCFPVTVIEAGPCSVTQIKTQERDGYDALQIAFGSRRPRNVSRAELGHLLPRGPHDDPKAADERQKALDKARRGKDIPEPLKSVPEQLREIPWDGKDVLVVETPQDREAAKEAEKEGKEKEPKDKGQAASKLVSRAPRVGDRLTVALFENMKKVDVVGTSKGRGFMGVVRRWGFHGLPATHGQSDRERAPGSLGRQHSISQGVYPGKRMAGHWGVEQVTSQNLEVVKINKEKNLLIVQGAVPGPTGGLVLVKESHWTPPKPSTVVSKKQKAQPKK